MKKLETLAKILSRILGATIFSSISYQVVSHETSASLGLIVAAFLAVIILFKPEKAKASPERKHVDNRSEKVQPTSTEPKAKVQPTLTEQDSATDFFVSYTQLPPATLN